MTCGPNVLSHLRGETERGEPPAPTPGAPPPRPALQAANHAAACASGRNTAAHSGGVSMGRDSSDQAFSMSATPLIAARKRTWPRVRVAPVADIVSDVPAEEAAMGL